MSVLIKNPTLFKGELMFQLEQIESNYWSKYYRADSMLPTFSTIIGGGVACAIPDFDILAMNRVLGLGLNSALDKSVLQQIIEFYRIAGSKRFFVQLPPAIALDSTRRLLDGEGFTHHNNWTKLYRKVQPLETSINEELSIREIDKREADNYGQLIFMSFDWEDSRLAPLLASTVGQVGYKHYIVSRQGKDIAAGALYVEGNMASMAFAGTLAPFRGKGAQRLLPKTRMEKAYKLGARFITSETAQHTNENTVVSYLNMKKVGFEVAYQRQNWLYDFTR